PVDPVKPVEPTNPVESVPTESEVTPINSAISINSVATENASLPKTGDRGITASFFGGIMLTITSAVLLRKRK
ncbi:LPXTG cell wall anchor domain-containing protein, partial [Listeria monocytogenes]|nr:LPXTG cell wall anchor domain-containing protein [Listeria monocytogenes]EHG9403180.1 LPXTG cell wall anchor domain-containing protein [Listeria monocytogenes]